MRWYKQDCNLYDRIWAKDSKMVTLYTYLHCAAYVNDGMYHGQIIRRGSCPTSRSAIMEATGLSEREVKSRLKKLLDYNEIIIKTSNIGSVITLCDYDGYTTTEDLFAQVTSSQVPNERPNEVPSQRPISIYNKTEEYKNLRITSKKERENSKALIYEIKELYNRTFDGVLPEWKRLSEKMVHMVELCISLYGRQSVDMVFDQIAHEPFSLGDNKNGFIADAFFIFDPTQFEKYLGRYKLRISKKSKQEPQPQATPVVEEKPEPSMADKRKVLLMAWVESQILKPTARGQEILTSAYQSGELQRLGIDWKPVNR